MRSMPSTMTRAIACAVALVIVAYFSIYEKANNI